MKVLPELLKSVEFGGGGPKALEVVMKIAAGLPSDEFDSRVTPVVIRLFGNPDRAVRVSLLDGLPLIIDRLSQKIVNDKIFPQLVRPVSQLPNFPTNGDMVQSPLTSSFRSLGLPMWRPSFENKP